MDSIIRGTNATIQIKIKEDLDFNSITALELHIYQPAHQIVKTLEDLTLDADVQTVTYELTQAESLSLVTGRNVEISLIGVADGKRFEARPVITAKVENTRKNEVMT
jgi:hypothetical protein